MKPNENSSDYSKALRAKSQELERRIAEEAKKAELLQKQQRELEFTLPPSAYAKTREQEVEKESLITRYELDNACREYTRSKMLCLLTLMLLVSAMVVLLIQLRSHGII